MTAPASVAELLPRAVELAIELGEVPSRNRLMSELRIGAQRASTVRETVESASIAWSTVRDVLALATGAEWVDDVRQRLLILVATGGSDLGQLPPGPHLAAGPAAAGPALVDEPTETDKTETSALATAFASPPETALVGPSPVANPPARLEDAPGAVANPVSDCSEPTPEPRVVPSPAAPARPVRTPRSWPLLVIAAPAAVAIWSGWVGLGELAGFGPVNLLPGIGSGFTLNTAITLPIGVEAYAAYALLVWLTGHSVPAGARRFARWSALSSLLVGIGGQAAYHLMTALGWRSAPWPVVVAVSALPVAVLGMAAGLTHLLRSHTAR